MSEKISIPDMRAEKPEKEDGKEDLRKALESIDIFCREVKRSYGKEGNRNGIPECCADMLMPIIANISMYTFDDKELPDNKILNDHCKKLTEINNAMIKRKEASKIAKSDIDEDREQYNDSLHEMECELQLLKEHIESMLQK